MSAGRELEALVAEKVFGLEVKEGYVWTVSRSSCPDGLPGCCVMHTDRMPVKPKPYSTDIASAWEVVEKMQERLRSEENTKRWCPDQTYRLEYDGENWTAGFTYDPVLDCMCPNPFIVCATAETAPLAICLAALKAVGHEPDNG